MASEKSSGSWRVSLPLPRPTEGHALSHLRLLPFPRHTRRYLHTPGPTLQSASPTPKPPSVSPGLLHPGTPTLISLQGPLGQNVHQGATPLQDPQYTYNVGEREYNATCVSKLSHPLNRPNYKNKYIQNMDDKSQICG